MKVKLIAKIKNQFIIQGYGFGFMEEGKDSGRPLQGCETRGCGNGSQVLENGSSRCEHQI